MPRKESEAVPEGNDPVSKIKEIGSGEKNDRELKIMESCFDRWDRKLDEMAEDWRSIDQHVASLEPNARQPRWQRGQQT